MRLAGSRAADKHDIALVGDEVATQQITQQRLVDRRVRRSRSLDVLGQRQLGDVIWYLIERACFSAISAGKRSPTIFGGSCWRLMPLAMTSS
jgi:hypothetical protein